MDSNYLYFCTPTFVELQRYCCLYRNHSWYDWSQTVLYLRNFWLVLRYQRQKKPPEFSWFLTFVYHFCCFSWIIGLLFLRNSSHSDFFLTFFQLRLPFSERCGCFVNVLKIHRCLLKAPNSFTIPGAINKQYQNTLYSHP